MQSLTPLLAAAVCVLCSAATQATTLSGQTHLPVAHLMTLRSLTVGKMMAEGELFENVPFDTNKQTACSPADPGIDWHGVKVRAPAQVFMPGKDDPRWGLIMPLCGIYSVNVAKAIWHPGPLMLIVTDVASGKTYRGPIVHRDPHPRIPPPPSRPLNPLIMKIRTSATTLTST